MDRRLTDIERLANRNRPSLFHKDVNLLELVGATPQKYALKVAFHLYGSNLKSMVILGSSKSTKSTRFHIPVKDIHLIQEAISQKFNLSHDTVSRFWRKIAVAINAKGRFQLYQYRKAHNIYVITTITSSSITIASPHRRLSK